MSQKPILAEISAGELIDKITILRIKAARLDDAKKKSNVDVELKALELVGNQLERELSAQAQTSLGQVTKQLMAVNEALWEIEDDIRDCERQKDFGETFIRLARSVYQQNDLRAALKRQVNEIMGSRLIEEKSYRPY